MEFKKRNKIQIKKFYWVGPSDHFDISGGTQQVSIHFQLPKKSNLIV